jgi:hypothetical protein
VEPGSGNGFWAGFTWGRAKMTLWANFVLFCFYMWTDVSCAFFFHPVSRRDFPDWEKWHMEALMLLNPKILMTPLSYNFTWLWFCWLTLLLRKSSLYLNVNRYVWIIAFLIHGYYIHPVWKVYCYLATGLL